jgi:hypothetical protein
VLDIYSAIKLWQEYKGVRCIWEVDNLGQFACEILNICYIAIWLVVSTVYCKFEKLIIDGLIH